MIDKLDLQTPNFTDENIERLAALFPDCVTEASDAKGKVTKAIDFDLLKQELSENIVDGPRERYQINWPGKREALVSANTPINKTLRPCRAESVDFDTTENLYIEGDNLEALKLLQESYLGKVKMIYIDPPYNTGKDFVYKDNFTADKGEYEQSSEQRDEHGGRLLANLDSNGRYHSDWLSMMYARLKLARNLLKDDGLIFISIDDNEVHNLKKVCDEIYGEDNMAIEFIWEKKYTTSNNIEGISSVHESILCYMKNSSFIGDAISKLPYSEEALARYKNPDNDPRGPWMDVSYHGPKTPAERPNLNYPIIHPKNNNEIWPIEKSWAYEKKNYNKHQEENRLWWGKTFTYKEPRLKKFLSEMSGGMVPKSLLTNKDVGGTSNGRDNLRELFGKDQGAIFDNPKPISLLLKLMQIGVKKDDLILDFFAGSSSTAHATVQLNAEDGGNRKFILVQIMEETNEKSEAYKAGYKTIPEIGKERIRRAGKKIKEENGDKEGIEELDIGFRVLKIDSSNMKDVYYSPDEVTQTNLFETVDNIKADRSAEDLLFQVLIDWGVDLSLPIVREEIQGKTVYFVDEDTLAACFEDDLDEAFVKELAGREVMRVVFKDSGFAQDDIKSNVEQIFKQLSPETEVKAI